MHAETTRIGSVNAALDRRVSVAPMMERTDRHCRYFLRLLSRRALLYTEMITADAVINGDRARLLAFDQAEHPVALQLGGADPDALARAAAIAEDWGYDEVNLNVGCPSDRVRSGRFGACLMAEPGVVADCVAAMRRATRLPVTVKCRIGIDGRDSYADLLAFVDTVASAGCETFVVHARTAVLAGLSPKENREVPPLRHGVVHRLKRERPGLEVVLNGGVRDLAVVDEALARCDGAMIGRAAYHDPCFLAAVAARVFGERPPERAAVAAAFAAYARRRMAAGVPLHAMTRHILGLYQGMPGARAWRRHLSEAARRPGADAGVIAEAAAQMMARAA